MPTVSPPANPESVLRPRGALVGVEAVILAGGLSQRMGHDKARLRIGGRSLLRRSGDAARALGIPVRVIRRDIVPRCGPIGGVCTALNQARAETILFLSCDMPSVRSELLQRLMKRLTPRRDAVFVEADGWVGFPFALRVRARDAVWQLHRNGGRSLQSIADHLLATRLQIGARSREQLRNINTPEARDAYAAALRLQQLCRKTKA